MVELELRQPPQLIGLAGRKQAGKDTLARSLQGRGYVILAFATPIKDMLAVFMRSMGASEDIIYRSLEGDLKEKPSVYFGHHTPRYAMQTLGDTWGRQCIGDRAWIQRLFPARVSHNLPCVIKDVRRHNEIDAIRYEGGAIVWVDRPRTGFEPDDDHISENEISAADCDLTVFNNYMSADDFIAGALPEIAKL